MNLGEIRLAIESLPADQQLELVRWLNERDLAAWDAEIECDFSPGGAGMEWLERVKRDVRDGKSRPLREQRQNEQA